MKFNLEWQETICYQSSIEADSLESALDKFSMGMADKDIVTVWVTTNHETLDIWEAAE